MTNEKDLQELDRSRRHWRMSTAFLGVALIASLAWGYDKKLDVDRAIVEEQKIKEALISLSRAMGISAPSETAIANPSVHTTTQQSEGTSESGE